MPIIAGPVRVVPSCGIAILPAFRPKELGGFSNSTKATGEMKGISNQEEAGAREENEM